MGKVCDIFVDVVDVVVTVIVIVTLPPCTCMCMNVAEHDFFFASLVSCSSRTDGMSFRILRLLCVPTIWSSEIKHTKQKTQTYTLHTHRKVKEREREQESQITTKQKNENARNKYDKLMKICHIFGTLDCNVAFLFRMCFFISIFSAVSVSLSLSFSVSSRSVNQHFIHTFDFVAFFFSILLLLRPFRWFDVTFIAMYIGCFCTYM